MKRLIVLTLAAAAGLAACATDKGSQVATVDISRITNNWPKFINYNNQLSSDAYAIDHSSAPESEKQRQRDALKQRYANMQNEVTGDVKSAAEQIASERHFKLVVTRQFVGYGGVDITPDVEKILKITEKAPPK